MPFPIAHLVIPCLLIGLALASPNTSHATTTIHVATAYAIDNFQTKNLSMCADGVTKATNGEAEAGGIIISGMDVLLHITSDYDDARCMSYQPRPAIEKTPDGRNLVLLPAAVPWPSQDQSQTSIGSVQDFETLRMYAYNAATERISVHAKPVTIKRAELFKTIAEQGSGCRQPAS